LTNPEACTAALKPIDRFEKMDQYDRCIAYLLDIEARAQRFINTYPQVPVCQVRLEELNSNMRLSQFFEQLNLIPTSETYQLLGRRINAKTERKKLVNSKTNLDTCRKRIDLYIKRAKKIGIPLPINLDQYLLPFDELN
jgi:hypothetical protein